MWKELTKKTTQSIIAVCYIVAAFAFIFLLIFKPVPEGNRDVVLALGCVLVGGANTIKDFYFGSSKTKEHETF